MIDNKDRHRFEAVENGLTVFADYRLQDGKYVLPHVEADPKLRGIGAAGRLMAEIVEHARANKLTLVLRCGYAIAWFKRHPDAADVLE